MKRVFYSPKMAITKRVINRLKKIDKKNQFTFSSIDGKKAKQLFTGNYEFLRKRKYVVYLEGQRVFVNANAILRIYWKLGRKVLGMFWVVPGFIVGGIYRLMGLFIWR